ncbi:MAG: YjbH domain-containing protein [Desulfovibrio sp.]|uniref:YjbH domain-containing protein n=1 Tax=Desulfovibrio sp. 7SRBS1 TaxID=3378064 RepID=UPI003B3E6028
MICQSLLFLLLFLSLLPACLLFSPRNAQGLELFGPAVPADTPPQPSLFGYSGLWETPTARVLPDWSARLGYGYASPYRVFSAGLGLFDRAEVSATLTEVETIEGFPGEGFGNYRDRAAGAKLVLLPETDLLPQVAVGFHDAFGTGLFPTRYIVAGKQLFGADLSLGLAQGVLAGDDTRGQGNILFSSPMRRTRPFAGLSYPLNRYVSLFGEYSSLRRSLLYGNDRDGGHGNDGLPFNAGLVVRPWEPLALYAVAEHGDDLAVGAALTLPLQAEGVFAWQKEKDPEPLEKERWKATQTNNNGLAHMVARKTGADGFEDVACRVANSAIWIEAENSRYLSDTRALARLGRLADSLCPPRISEFFLNLKANGQIRLSLRTGRAHLRAYLESRLDEEGFLAFASLQVSGSAHRGEFLQLPGAGAQAQVDESPWFLQVDPKLRTFLGNRSGYLHSKMLLQTRAGYEPLPGGLLLGELETVLYNDYSSLRFPPLESDPVRTDTVAYEQGYGTNLSVLAYDQIFELPADITGRLSVGYFESAFAGVGAEVFRFVNNGRAGLGLESELVRKRDPDSLLGLYDSSPYCTLFLNLYTQLWPRMGVDAGLKLGRFLGGDWGGRLEVRRTFRHVTVGVWWTVTDTSVFSSEKNRDYSDKGIFIRVPFSVVMPHDTPGYFSYAMSGFIRDQGQTVRQPRSLFPSDDANLPQRLRHTLGEMRQ